MRYARYISRVKFALVALAALGTLALFYQATPEQFKNELENEFEQNLSLTQTDIDTASSLEDRQKEIDQAVERVSGVKMLGPKYSGLDDDGRQWRISAESAQQVGESYKRIALNNFLAQATTKKGQAVAFGASYGFYDANNKKVVLKDAVHAEFEGYKLLTEQAEYKLDSAEAVVPAALKIQGPEASIQANAFQMTNSGDQMAFTGGVKVQFYPKGNQ